MVKKVKSFREDKPRIYIIDVTNRDGVQTSRLCLAKLQKTILNYYLNKVGANQSEFGFPTTDHEYYYLNANLELYEIGALSPLILSGWLRAIPEDVNIAFKNAPNLKHVNLSISTSDQMIKGKFQGKMDRSKIIDRMTKATGLAKELGAETIGVNAEDASRTDLEYLIDFGLAAKESGANRLRYCDTIGYDTDPIRTYNNYKTLSERLEMAIETHSHGDADLAVANSVIGATAILEAGQDAYINTTINKIGERTGNADLLSTIIAFKKGSNEKKNYEFARDLDLTQFYKLSKYAAESFGVQIPITQVGVGANAFAHESGIHADGVLKDRQNYELYDFSDLGIPKVIEMESGRVITVGEYSGIKGFIHVCGKVGVKFEDEKSARNYLELTRYVNINTQKPLTEDELVFTMKYPVQVAKIVTVTPFYHLYLTEFDKILIDKFGNNKKPIFSDKH